MQGPGPQPIHQETKWNGPPCKRKVVPAACAVLCERAVVEKDSPSIRTLCDRCSAARYFLAFSWKAERESAAIGVLEVFEDYIPQFQQGQSAV